VKKVDILRQAGERRSSQFSPSVSPRPDHAARDCESLRSQNSVLASGSIDTHGDRMLVRVSGQLRVLTKSAMSHCGGRAADQARRFHDDHGGLRKSPPTYTVRHNGAVLMSAPDDQRRQHRRLQGDEEAAANVQAELPHCFDVRARRR